MEDGKNYNGRFTITTIEVLGMPLQRWTHESCTADFAVGDDGATLYNIESAVEGKGHATALLAAAKELYEGEGNKRFGGTVALTDRMAAIYKRLGIQEYDGE